MKKIVADDDVRDLQNFRLKFIEACKASELGELRISIPDAAIPGDAMTAEPITALCVFFLKNTKFSRTTVTSQSEALEAP
jgi:hypothetical protein